MEQEYQFASRLDGINGSVIRDIFKITAKPGVISFAGGNPSPRALPDEIVAPLGEELVRSNGKVLLQYGMTEGLPALRESLCPYIASEFGVSVTQDEVLPVTGSTQAFSLLLDALTNPGDTILTEAPTFLGAVQAMKLHQLKVVAVACDEDGIIPDALEEAIRQHHPKMHYTIPTFQNPTGITVSIARRQAIARIAQTYRLWVAEDDPYRSLRYSGESLPAIKSYDTSGYVLLMGSFSKVISPGLRVGFLAAPPKLIRKCVICKQSDDLHTANLNQAIVDAYLRRGLLSPHLKEVCAEYKRQLDTMLEALLQVQGVTRFTRPQGGLFVFVWLKEGMDAVALLPKAVEHGVAYVPGTYFYPDGGHMNTLRLNFSNADCETIQKGIRSLDACLA